MVMTNACGFSYVVDLSADPGALPRVLEGFAQNNIVPDSLNACRTGADGLQVELTVSDIDYMRARVIGAKIGVQVCVRAVRLFQLQRRAVVGAHGGVFERVEVLL